MGNAEPSLGYEYEQQKCFMRSSIYQYLQHKVENFFLCLSKICADSCDFLEAVKDHRGNSEPLFLLYRNGTLKHRIEGANAPFLANCINELTPMTADADDIEVVEHQIIIS